MDDYNIEREKTIQKLKQKVRELKDEDMRIKTLQLKTHYEIKKLSLSTLELITD